MTEKLICPKCSKPSHTSSVYSYTPCPYCGSIFSKDGMDRRKEERMQWSSYCEMFLGGVFNPGAMTAKIQDISKKGVRIRYGGKPLAVKSNVNIHIASLDVNRSAVVRWSDYINDGNAEMGLMFTKPISMPESLINK